MVKKTARRDPRRETPPQIATTVVLVDPESRASARMSTRITYFFPERRSTVRGTRDTKIKLNIQ